MATQLSPALGIISGVTWIDIYERPAISPKNLSNIEEADWVNIGGFREGTFNFTGDDMTITPQKYENGQNIVSTTKDGTYGIEGNLPDISKAVCKKLLRMKDLNLTAATGAYVKGRDVIGYGDSIGLLENIMVRLRFEQGAWDSLVYPNANISSKLQGSGSSEDLLDIQVEVSTSKSEDTDTAGQIWVLVGKKP